MSDLFNSIKQGLNEAVAFSEGKCQQATVHQFSPVDVKKLAWAKLNFHQLLALV